MKRMGPKKPFSEKNVNGVPDQSGVYNLINRQGDIVYTGQQERDGYGSA